MLLICWFWGFIDYNDGAAAMAMTAAGNRGGEGEGGMGEEGFDSGEWIGEGINEATPASLDGMMMTKPAPHEATASVELHPICLLAVWPVSVSYRHLPVSIFGSIFLYCKIWQELHFVKFCRNSFL